MIYIRKEPLKILYKSRIEYGENYESEEPWCGDEGFLLNIQSLAKYKVNDWREFFSEKEMMIKYTSSGEIYYLNRSNFSKVLTNAVTHPALIEGGGFDFLMREYKILKRQGNRNLLVSEKLIANKDKLIKLIAEYIGKIL